MSGSGVPAPAWVYMGLVSFGSTVLLLALLVHAWRRWGHFPSVVYRHRAIPQRAIGLVWVAVLAGSYLLAAAGVLGWDLGRSSSMSESLDPADLGVDRPLEHGESYYLSRFAPPFYEYSVRATRDSTSTYRRYYAQARALPSEFLVASLFYLVLVVMWKPGTPATAKRRPS